MTQDGTDTPEMTLIAALDRGGVIGANGGMPWHIPGDLRWFKQQTRGRAILMGRRTFESIGRALPHRRNLVLTRDSGFEAEDTERVADVDSALQRAAADDADQLMVIGGAQVYALTLARASRLLLTQIEADYDGDTFFPAVDWSEWRLESEQTVATDGDTPAHRFMTWRRVRA